MNCKIEKNILKYLDITYGESELYENEEKICVNGVCVYYKDVKQVGWTGVVHLDLVRTFGQDRYYPQLNKWFSKKYNLEVINPPIFN